MKEKPRFYKISAINIDSRKILLPFFACMEAGNLAYTRNLQRKLSKLTVSLTLRLYNLFKASIC